MKELLNDLYLNESPDSNYTRNDLLADRLKQQYKEGNREVMLELAVQLMMAGKEDESLIIMSHFFAKNKIDTIKGPEAADLVHWFALLYFRKGEVDNCRDNHNASSCILPLNSEAQHRTVFGSQNAQRLYTKLLQYNPDDAVAHWMLNLSAMTLGTYPKSVPKAWRLDFDKFADLEQPFPKFVDVGQALGINGTSYFGGAIIEDFNNDGLLDLFDTDGPLNRDVRLWIRQPDGTFANKAVEAGLRGITGGVNAMQTDFNNDGWADIFIVRGGWLAQGGNQPPSLLRNNRDGTFTDITLQAGLYNQSPSHTAVWADFDNDGLLDLIVGNETGTFEQLEDSLAAGEVPQNPTLVYRNNGNETFTNVTQQSGINLSLWVKGAVVLDYNRDGLQDVYLSVFNHGNFLFKNISTIGHIQFEDVTASAGVEEPIFSFPVVAADFNNDGWEDLFVAGYHPMQQEVPREYMSDIPPIFPSYTYINQKDGTFSKEAFAALPQSIMAMSLNVADFDNDGYLDIFLGTGAGMLTSLFPNTVLKNVEGKRWANVTTTARLGHLQKAHGVAMADIDRDGDLDIYLELGGLFHGDVFWNALYENTLTEPLHWISLKLIGSQSNMPAIGARIEIVYEADGQTKSIVRVVSSGGSYGASPWEQHIALGGKVDKITMVKIVWPSGKTATVGNLKMQQYYEWKENRSIPKLRKVRIMTIPQNQDHTNHQHHH